jgi:hypothetical protein
MIKNIGKYMLLIGILFFNKITFSQVNNVESIFKQGIFGLSTEYSYQKMNILSIGPNYCLGVQSKYNGDHFYSFETLYSAVIVKNEFHNGFKTGFNYSFISDNRLGVTSGFNLLLIKNNLIASTELGMVYFIYYLEKGHLGALSLSYGYSVNSSDNDYISPNRIILKLIINKSYALKFNIL